MTITLVHRCLGEKVSCDTGNAASVTRAMESIFEQLSGDVEAAHRLADDLMVMLLSHAGYGGAARVFQEADKWYS